MIHVRSSKTLKRKAGCVFNFEKLRFRDGLGWTVGLTVKIKLLRRCVNGVLGSFFCLGYSVQYTDHSLEKESRLSRYSSEPAHVTKYDVI